MSNFLKKHGLSPVALFVEFVSILLGISLAFAVTEWRETRANREGADVALHSIAAEMSRNCTAMVRSQAYYAQIRTTLDSLITAGAGKGPAQRLDEWQGLHPPIITNASFEVASVTGTLSHMPFRTADAIALAYSTQSLFQRSLDHSMMAVLSGGFETVEEAHRVLSIMNEVSLGVLQTYRSIGDGVLADYGYACETVE